MTLRTSNSELYNLVEDARKVLINLATFNGAKYEDYERARGNLLAEPALRLALPEWIISNRYGSQFWGLMKRVSPHYQGRRDFIDEAFNEILTFIEKGASDPVALSLDSLLKGNELPILDKAWKKAQSRLETDIDGTITAARSMLETTIKHILDERGQTYGPTDDLPDLYKKVSKALDLSPEGHDEQPFLQLVSGVTSTVHGISRMRNSYGDAHGASTSGYSAENRHGELALHLAGALATFLLRSHQESDQAKQEQESGAGT